MGKNEVKSGDTCDVFDFLKIPLVLKHKIRVSSSKGVKVMVCVLDHSGIQPFNYIHMRVCFGLSVYNFGRDTCTCTCV